MLILVSLVAFLFGGLNAHRRGSRRDRQFVLGEVEAGFHLHHLEVEDDTSRSRLAGADLLEV